MLERKTCHERIPIAEMYADDRKAARLPVVLLRRANDGDLQMAFGRKRLKDELSIII